MNAMTQIPDLVAMLGDHLWQSTVFVLAIAALTLAFRKNRAHVRYGLWLVASLKFLAPFGALVTLGHQFGWLSPFRMARVERVFMVRTQIAPPTLPPAPAVDVPMPLPENASAVVWPELLPLILTAIWAAGMVALLIVWWMRWRRMALIASAASVLTEGREVEMLRRLEQQRGVKRPLPIAVTDTPLEPGVFGIWRPVLLWPRNIEYHLNADQVRAILAHEVCHVRRRDNLAAAIQTIVQAVFWFHPLVWWLGSRLVEERERACDEDVIRQGSRPQVYAESILRTCQFYVEGPVACVAGVTGSDLKRRIEQIMRNHPREPLGPGRKVLLAVAAVATITGPVVFGALNAPLQAQVVLMRTVDSSRQLHFKLTTHVEQRTFPARDGLVRLALWDAFERQLGLRLEEQTAPVDVLVIDRIDRPRGR